MLKYWDDPFSLAGYSTVERMDDNARIRRELRRAVHHNNPHITKLVPF